MSPRPSRRVERPESETPLCSCTQLALPCLSGYPLSPIRYCLCPPFPNRFEYGVYGSSQEVYESRPVHAHVCICHSRYARGTVSLWRGVGLLPSFHASFVVHTAVYCTCGRNLSEIHHRQDSERREHTAASPHSTGFRRLQCYCYCSRYAWLKMSNSAGCSKAGADIPR